MRALAIIAAVLSLPAVAPAATVTRITPPSAFHGVHGIRFSPTGELYAGSVAGQSLYVVDTARGTARTLVGPGQGMADDMSFGPGGQVVWTAISDGVVYSRRGKGPVEEIARLVSINSIAFSRDGKRLFAAQVFGGDALWELDPAGKTPPRQIIKDMGGFNSFSPGPDGWLYGPLWFKGQVVRINPDTGELKVVAENLGTPAAAHFDSKDNLYAINTAKGEVLRIDVATGQATQIAQLSTALDNFAIDAADRMVVSNMADNGLQWVDVKTGKVRQIMKGALAFPADIAVMTDEEGAERLYVADVFAYRGVDGATGKVTDIARVHTDGQHLEYPTGATAYADKVVLASSPTGEVQVFDRATGERLSTAGGFAAPSDALLLEDGSLLVAEMGSGNLVRSREEKTVIVKGMAGPASLAHAPHGGVYVAEVNGGRITRVDPATGARVTIASGLSLPKAVAVAPDGSLVVLEVGKKRVVRIDPGDGRARVIAAGLPVGLVTQPAPLAGGVAVAPSGTIYVTSDVENAIYRIRP